MRAPHPRVRSRQGPGRRAAHAGVEAQHKAAGPAREWLDKEVGNTITGLLPTAAGRGKLAEAAIEYLREAKRKGHEAIIRAAVKDAPAEVAESIRKNVLDFVVKEYPLLSDKKTPTDLKAALVAKPVKGTAPAWASPDALPHILVDEHRLSDEQVKLVIERFRRTARRADPLITALKKHAEPASLDAFAWKLFQQWQGEGYPPKEKWAMGAIGHFGGDASARRSRRSSATGPVKVSISAPSSASNVSAPSAPILLSCNSTAFRRSSNSRD